MYHKHSFFKTQAKTTKKEERPIKCLPPLVHPAYRLNQTNSIHPLFWGEQSLLF